MNQIKLILLDLDLTLLRSDGSLSAYSVEVLKKCREKGILIGFCTGRGTRRIEKYTEVINPEIIVANAGASIFYKGKLIHSESFSPEETRTLLNKVYEAAGTDAEITVDTIDDFFWNKKENKSTQYMPEAKFDDFKNFSQSAVKFCVQTTDIKIVEKINSACSNCDSILFSDIPWYKFAPKSATKENGIRFLSDYLKIPLENMVAFGDDFTDIGMLKICGKGIAMKNAILQVKEAADEITDSCDNDGVARWLEKNMKEYKFWGWKTADCVPSNPVYSKIKNPRELYDYLSKIWCADTCAPRMRESWTLENQTLGQCSITAFLAQDIFGGKVYGILRNGGNYHCYNVVGNCVFDLTSEQFGDEKLCYENNQEQFREVHFLKEEKHKRYEFLKTELLKALKE